MTPGRKHTQDLPLGASFRDPSGFLFLSAGKLLRQVNSIYQEHYDRLMNSGLYQELVKQELLIPHNEIEHPGIAGENGYKVLEPELVRFISYPYEWSFTQLKDAALLTLQIQKLALDFGMILKDSSAYNIQFHHGRPILIDTLSFEIYQEGSPWVAYRQLCQHFLAPLSLMAYRDIRLNQLSKAFLDGIPLDLASKLLPFRTIIKLPLLLHVHLHAASQRRYSASRIDTSRTMSKVALLGLIDSLEGGINALHWKATGTEWAEYYSDHNYSLQALEHKKDLVGEYIDQINPASIWDLGANVGLFSRLASDRGIPTIAFDIDPVAVERNYLQCKQNGENNLLPLVQDLSNPSPDLGWHSNERISLTQRGPAGAVLALALIHHLAITHNVPIHHLALYFRDLSKWLMIEFIPKSDTQVQRLLASRADIFTEYTQASFEQAFSTCFYIHRKTPIRDSERWLYLMEAHGLE